MTNGEGASQIHGEVIVDVEMKNVIANDNIDDHVISSNRISQENVFSNNKIRLEWHELNVNVFPSNNGIFGKCCMKKREVKESTPVSILRNVSGVAESGKLLAIMGASGAGKTTLLNVLSQQNEKGMEVTGSILVNDRNIEANIKSISAYVQQESPFIGTITVKEHLVFQAMLRMDPKYSKQDKMHRVDKIISQFGLQKCQDTIIGVLGRIQGISGGERKRLSFATEIITDTSLLFVDEPTSGLDSFMAENCVLALKKLATEGRTIITTIHQPPSRMYQLFDHILLLSNGRTAFQGSIKETEEFFVNCGYPTPHNFNPADHYMYVLASIPGSEEESKERSETICDTFASYQKTARKEDSEIEEHTHLEVIGETRYKNPLVTQLYMLLWRNARQLMREPLLNQVRLINKVVISVLLGLLFFRLDVDQAGLKNINGVIFFTVMSASVPSYTSVITLFPTEIPIFLKENKLVMYRVGVYFLAKQLAELPSYFLGTSIYLTICYWMTGLNPNFTTFLRFFGINHLIVQVAISYGMIISTAAPTPSVAVLLSGPCMMLMVLTSGFFVMQGDIAPWLGWLQSLSWMKHGIEATMINQWVDYGPIACPNNSLACVRDGKDVLSLNGYDPDDIIANIGSMVALIVGCRFIAYLFILIRAYRNR